MARSAPYRGAAQAISGLAGALLLSMIPLLGGPGVTPAASASACGALHAAPYGDPSGWSILLTAPTALTGQGLRAGNVALSQRGEPVGVRAMRHLSAAQVDVAIVLDTGGSARDSRFARARRFALSFLADLPRGIRVAVISAGSKPEVLSVLGADRAQALAAVRRGSRSDRHAGVNGVALAGDLLNFTDARARHIVLISTGRGDASPGDITQEVKALGQRGMSIHAVGIGRSVERSWGAQCPTVVGAGQAPAAASLLALRVSGTYEVVPVRADPLLPVAVRVRAGHVDVSAQVPPPGPDTAVLGTRIDGSAPAGAGRGGGHWLLTGLVVAVLALVVALLLLPPMALPGLAKPPGTSGIAESDFLPLSQGRLPVRGGTPKPSPKWPPVV